MDSPHPERERAGGETEQEYLIALRDSKDPTGPVLFLDEAQWRELVRKIKLGEYDLR
jgi:Domain of unknown function (DUF397)